jgi:hypothetical protein
MQIHRMLEQVGNVQRHAAKLERVIVLRNLGGRL